MSFMVIEYYMKQHRSNGGVKRIFYLKKGGGGEGRGKKETLPF